MKGIILAGGNGTRLFPLTKGISKHLLPVYDKPMIYYPLSVLMLAEIRDILIVSTERDLDKYKELLGDGSQLGLSFKYEVQKKPKGIADVFLVGENFIGSDNVCLILGDNIFYGAGISGILKKAREITKGAVIFGHYADDPCEFGVIKFDSKRKIISIEEKSKTPKSHYVVPGLYFYDNNVIKIAKKIKPSNRGELEITSINNKYLDDNLLSVKMLGRGMTWLDMGTHDRLLKASNFVEAIQKEQGLYVACIEEIACRMGFINKEKLKELAQPILKTNYGKYLIKILKMI
jgi:glucose-1-phosphate thymidylyltransferase